MFLSRCHTPSKMSKHDAFVGQFGRTKPTGENAPVPAESAHSSRKEVRSRVGNGGFDVAHAPCKRSRPVDSPAGSTSDDIHISPVDHGRTVSRLHDRPRREPRGQRRSRRCPPYDAVLPQFWRNEASALARPMTTLSVRSLAERSQRRSLRRLAEETQKRSAGNLAERSQQVRTLRSRPSQRTPREKRCAVGWATAASTLPTRLASSPAPSIHQRARAATTFISVRSIMEDPFRGSMIGHAASRKGCAAG